MIETKQQKLDLLSLGYRKINNNDTFWCKPVGLVLLMVDFKEKHPVWSNRFIGCDNKVYVWERKIFTDKELESFKRYISYFETYTRYDLGKSEVDMSFLTKQEYLELVL